MSYEDELEKLQTPKYELLKNAGKIVNCIRCGVPCLVAEAANRHGRPFQFADGEGYCPPCAITQYLKSDEMDIAYLLPEGTDFREALRAPHVQQLFAGLLKVGMADLQENQIDWEAVITNWDLPFPKRKRSRSKPKKDDGEWAEYIN